MSCTDIARAVRAIALPTIDGGSCYLRAKCGRAVLAAHGIRADIVSGILAFCGGDVAVCAGHHWLETDADLIDFSAGDWVREGPAMRWTGAAARFHLGTARGRVACALDDPAARRGPLYWRGPGDVSDPLDIILIAVIILTGLTAVVVLWMETRRKRCAARTEVADRLRTE